MSARLDEILATLQQLVAFDVRELYDANSALKPVALWPPGASLSVAGIKSREIFSGYGEARTLIGVEHDIRLADRVKALELSLRELGQLSPDRTPVEELPYEEWTDAQLMHALGDPALRATGSNTVWQDATGEEIDKDFHRIVALYDELRPGVRLNLPPENAAAPVRRMLPSPAMPPTEMRIRRLPASS